MSEGDNNDRPRVELVRADINELGLKLADAMTKDEAEHKRILEREGPERPRELEGHGEVPLLEKRCSNGDFELSPLGNLKPGLRPFTVRAPTLPLAIVKFRIRYANELMAARYVVDWEDAKRIAARTEFPTWKS